MTDPLTSPLYRYGTPENLVATYIPEETFNAPIERIPRSNSMAYESLQLYAGNNHTYHIYVKSRCMNDVDITGATGVLTWKSTKDGTVTFQKSTAVPGEGEIGAPTKGEMYFYLVPADTNTLEYRQYKFDVTLTMSDGKVYTVLEGVVTLKEPVNT